MTHFSTGLAWLFFILCATAAAAAPEIKPAPPQPPTWCLGATHAPLQPHTGDAVKITAQVLPDVTGVILQYQTVEPGAYVELKDPAYAASWLSVPMQAGNKTKEAATFTADLSSKMQQHRRLVRYRIATQDSSGKRVYFPDASDASPNFAYFVYDGIPGWAGAINPQGADPTLTKVMTFPPAVFNRVQAYHLIGKKVSIENATWNEQAGGKEFKYTGTLVVDGEVFDHVHYRARGGVWRYAIGKNMWKIDLPAEHRLHAKDDLGQPYAVPWSKINLRGCIQLGTYGRRGEQGMYEAVSFRLFNLAGVEAPRTHWVQLRIIDEPAENPPDQYHGDFWGLYLAIENEDGKFLKAHGLPDGNLFKMANGTGELNHQGVEQVADRSDLDKFLANYEGDNPTDDWWRANLNLPSYYSYRSICECIHHYDIGSGKNYDYYHNPVTARWQVIPWDLDLTWASHMFGNGEEPFKSRVLVRPGFRLDYQNRLREIRDLLFNPEQTGQLIDECAAIICDPAGAPSIVEADRRKWDNHPALALGGGQAGQGQFYRASRTHDFPGMTKLMKDYIKTRGTSVDAALLKDPKIPETPTANYTGPREFPADQLRFRAGPYQGSAAFAAMKWRLAEITPNAAPRTPHSYEITALWESPELLKLDQEVTIPALTLPGHTYRVRVRMKDATNRWSHWSDPVEFTAAQPPAH